MVKVRRDGYYHIFVMRAGEYQYSYPKINVTDFKIRVDAQLLVNEEAANGRYGIIFRLAESTIGNDFYAFSIDGAGGFYLDIFQSNQWKRRIASGKSPSIKHANYDIRTDDNDIEIWHPTNSLMVEAKQDKIFLGVNQKLVTTIEDKTLEHGYCGLFVWHHEVREYDTLFPDLGVRFRNFRLYSIIST